MRFAKVVFLVAGIYGLIVMAPQYFLEAKNGRDFPPAINHPEFYYGFIGIGVAWQVVFLFLSRDPVRYRPMMIQVCWRRQASSSQLSCFIYNNESRL